MRHCDKCNVDVESNLKNCPLCGAYLQNDNGEKTKNKYAYREVIDKTRSRQIFLKLLIFASIIASVVCLIVDILTSDKLTWSIHLVTAIIGTWLVVLKPIFAHTKVRIQLVLDMVIAAVIVFYAEYFAKTTNNWAFHLGLPIVFMATLGLFGLMMIIDNKRWRQYAMTVTPIAFLAIIPLFISLGVFKMIGWAWYVTTGIAVIMLVSFFVFGKQGYISELKMKLHF